MLHERGHRAGPLPRASQPSGTFSLSRDVAAAHHRAGPTTSGLFVGGRATETPVCPPALNTKPAPTTRLCNTADCPSIKCPPLWTILPDVGGAASAFLSCVHNTSALIPANTATWQYPSTWQALLEETQATTAYSVSVQQTKQLLSDFERYQCSVGASPLTHNQRCAACPLDSFESSGGAAGTTSRPHLDVNALGSRGAPSAAISIGVCGSVGNVATGHAAQPLQASPSSSPCFNFQFDIAAFELAKQRSLEMLYYNAEARTAYTTQGLQLSRAVCTELLKQPRVAIDDVVAMEGASIHPTNTAETQSDREVLACAAQAGDELRTSHTSASRFVANDTEQERKRSRVAAVQVMSEAERVTATAEAERALSLLYTIRAVRRQTEDLTMRLLHACGEWGCWSTPTANFGPTSDQMRASSPSSPLPGCPQRRQCLFADLFMPESLTSTTFRTPPGVSDGSSKSHLLVLGEADYTNTARLSAVSAFAKESVCRRERACRVLREALQQQQQRWSLSTATAATTATPADTTTAPAAGATFLEMAMAPPQRAVPPPPPTSVQLEVYALQQGALRGFICQWRERAAAMATTSALKAADASPVKEAAAPCGPAEQELYNRPTQRRQLQDSYDVPHAAAVQCHHMSTHSPTDKQLEVQPRETTATFIEDVAAREVTHRARGTSEVVSDESPEVGAPAPPSLLSPPTAVPDTLSRVPSSLAQQHSSAVPRRSSHASPPSEAPLISSVQRAEDCTRAWVNLPTALEASASSSPSPPRRTDSLRGAVTSPIDTEISERGAGVPAQQAEQPAVEDESSRCTKSKPELAVHIEAQATTGNTDGSHAAACASSANPTQVTNVLCTSLSSSSLTDFPPSAALGAHDVVGAMPKVYEASRSLHTAARLSTHPETAAGLRREGQHRKGRRRRRGDRRGSTAVAELEDPVRRHLTRLTSQHQKREECDVATPLSTELTPQALRVAAAAARLHATSSGSAISNAAAAPPPAVVRHGERVFPGFVVPSSCSVVRAVSTAAAVLNADQPDGGEEPRASPPQHQPPSPTITSTAPSHLPSASSLPAPEAAIFALWPPPHSVLADAAPSHSPMSSMKLPEGGLERVGNASIATPSLAALAPVSTAHPGLTPTSGPPLPSLHKPKLADGGGLAGVTKLPQRQGHRNFFSRLFSCGG
ncbi:hypothetical protein Q4I28_001074 [Leishmania naiffi]|uniref:Ig-like domain-containing protein n=1 Tax=Leishmania naiffi TaxID=5678 RepID=A0AAW3C8N3_9TRYP